MAEENKIDIQEKKIPEAVAPQKTAVAIRYDVDKDKAPMILASGRGPIAQEILRIADDNKIPMYEDPELAQLLSKLELDTEIPAELYVLVAGVLFFVYKLDRMAEKREKLLTRMKEEKK